MLKLLRFLVLVLCFQPVALMAQDKVITIEDLFRNRDLFPKSLTNLQWIPSTHNYSYIKNDSLMEGASGSTGDHLLINLERLNDAIKLAGGELMKSFPSVHWTGDYRFWFLAGNDLFTYQIKEKIAVKKNSGGKDAENIDVAPLTFNMAFTIKNNLYLSVDGKNLPVTSDPDTGIVNGKFVHRNEWGINKGTFWSPKGDLLAFYHMDESMVTRYPLVDIDSRPAEVKYVRYPMAGMNSHQVTIGVFDTRNKKTIWLETGEPRDQFLTNITWTPDQKYILVAVLNRAQDHMWMRQYDVSTGKFIKTLFEETDEQYVEPLHGPVFLNKIPSRFIWQSPRDGYNQLYLYDLSGQLIKQLTSDHWDTGLTGIDPEDQSAWYMAAAEKPIERNLYKVDLKSGKTSRITTDAGTHSVSLSSDYALFIDNFSNTHMASRITVNDNNGKQTKELLKDENPLRKYKTGSNNIFTLKSADGSDLYCRMTKPPDFDSTKKYPVVIYVYGGPHSQLVTNSWLGGAGLFLTYLATKGYIVFSLDNHGTSNRGRDFEQVIHRKLGQVEVQDQMVGVNYLKRLSYVDPKRIAVHGWSYGGFMTISMLLQHPDDFKAAVAGGPVIDWKYYEVMYGERYMDTPQENPEGYKKAALEDQVEQLKAKLLIIHGTMDETVVWQNSLDFIKKCVDKGKLVDYFVYPGHEHNVGGIDRLHLYRKIEQYLEDNL